MTVVGEGAGFRDGRCSTRSAGSFFAFTSLHAPPASSSSRQEFRYEEPSFLFPLLFSLQHWSFTLRLFKLTGDL